MVINGTLKGAMVSQGFTYGDMAAYLGINTKVFGNKINHRKQCNGNPARFTENEKSVMAIVIGINRESIE